MPAPSRSLLQTISPFFLSLLLLAAGQPDLVHGADQPRPANVVFIVIDDVGYGDLGYLGCKDIPTPNIDALARDSVRCTNGYVSCPYCSPTRAGLLTGRYQQRFGHEFNPALLANGGAGQGMPTSEVTIASRLKDAGYSTALVGKWHLGEEEKFHPLNRGFGEFFGFLAGAHSYVQSEDKAYGPIYRGRKPVELKGYLTDVLAQEAVDFMNRNAKQPFFLYLAFNASHTPLQAPEETLKKLEGIADPNRRAYAALTIKLDEAVGTVLARLRGLGLEENTLVFFIGDNGGPIGKKFAGNSSTNGPLRGSKGDTWEGGIRVPFLAHWKGRLQGGKTYNHPVIQLDLHATALALAGVAAKPEWHLDGVNLLPFLEGKEKAAPHEVLFWRFGEQMAIRKGDWKLVRGDLDLDKPWGNVVKQPLLFNLAEDMGEKKDLAGAHPERVKDLQRTWDAWNAGLKPAAWLHHSLQPPKK